MFDTDLVAMEKTVSDEDPNAKPATAALQAAKMRVEHPATETMHRPAKAFHPGVSSVCSQRLFSVSTTTSTMPRAFAVSECQRLAGFYTGGTAEVHGTAEASS